MVVARVQPREQGWVGTGGDLQIPVDSPVWPHRTCGGRKLNKHLPNAISPCSNN